MNTLIQLELMKGPRGGKGNTPIDCHHGQFYH